jgi:ER membrane protein complex subunit 2
MQKFKQQLAFIAAASTANQPFVPADSSLKTPLTPTEFHQLCLDLTTSTSQSSPEYWDVQEHLFLTALQLHNKQELAAKTLQRIKERFPKSRVRVRLLEGMLMESEGRFKDAMQVYQQLLKDEDETLLQPRKRIICCLLSSQDSKPQHEEAVKQLVEHVETFSGDLEAWEMLADLYEQEKMFEQAAYCVEEILVQRPTHWGYLVKYAGLMFQMQSAESVAVARKYYCLALEYEPTCTTALQGTFISFHLNPVPSVYAQSII